MPEKVKAIRIFDLDLVPELDRTHRDYEKRNRIKNHSKSTKMKRIITEEWDKAFLAVYNAAKPKAPNLASELYKLCGTDFCALLPDPLARA